ncbi:hypothetical protein WMY93_023421 [Mugilogobius chulae]|uniref:Uncharacterized protein n=1 Tax=Mugilogobius chulae TaxID=88201 RepID=A0AAW0NER0_9GOBI
MCPRPLVHRAHGDKPPEGGFLEHIRTSPGFRELYSTQGRLAAVGAMLFKSTAVCLLALAMFSSFCDAQLRPSNPQWPSDVQQSRQTFEKPLDWKYPEDPHLETLPQPATLRSDSLFL